ncbi:MAG TPA: SDR family oxidoreductase [Streptosporangiaceae bacterium]|nr:SDR family oxidoreductase [Streptosporangiaceae bacterium]
MSSTRSDGAGRSADSAAGGSPDSAAGGSADSAAGGSAGDGPGGRHDFGGKVAIVTGAAQGIGEAYARALAAAGAAVVVADVNAESGAAVAASIEAAGGLAEFARTDVSDPASARAMAGLAVERFGGIDYLVNNAAIYGTMRLDLMLTVDWDYYKSFMGVNMDGALACTRACYEHMASRGGGAVVNQSSTAAWLYSSFYGLAKAGVNALTQQLAHELGGMNIRVNALAPGPTDTAATRSVVGDLTRDLVKSLALKRMGQPADMVGACLFLLSDEAGWITGQVLNVDGGQVFRP